jgi:hypothetical protein
LEKETIFGWETMNFLCSPPRWLLFVGIGKINGVTYSLWFLYFLQEEEEEEARR